MSIKVSYYEGVARKGGKIKLKFMGRDSLAGVVEVKDCNPGAQPTQLDCLHLQRPLGVSVYRVI